MSENTMKPGRFLDTHTPTAIARRVLLSLQSVCTMNASQASNADVRADTAWQSLLENENESADKTIGVGWRVLVCIGYAGHGRIVV
jgi:hypothetical protein